jgi:hypothetical protein
MPQISATGAPSFLPTPPTNHQPRAVKLDSGDYFTGNPQFTSTSGALSVFLVVQLPLPQANDGGILWGMGVNTLLSVGSTSCNFPSVALTAKTEPQTGSTGSLETQFTFSVCPSGASYPTRAIATLQREDNPSLLVLIQARILPGGGNAGEIEITVTPKGGSPAPDSKPLTATSLPSTLPFLQLGGPSSSNVTGTPPPTPGIQGAVYELLAYPNALDSPNAGDQSPLNQVHTYFKTRYGIPGI